VFGPAKLPPAITGKLHEVIVAGLADATLRERLQNEGATPVGDTPAEFATFVRQDIQRWAPIVKASGATLN
jgi:tripartite-type tricarboxylate transporter receptor subunit TctC